MSKTKKTEKADTPKEKKLEDLTAEELAQAGYDAFMQIEFFKNQINLANTQIQGLQNSINQINVLIEKKKKTK